MSVVLDTCALLWWSLEPAELSATAAIAIEKMEQEKNGVVPSMAIWEIAIKVKNKKFNLGIPLSTYVAKLKQSDAMQIISVDEDLLVRSVNLSWSHRDPVDRIVVALALDKNCPIITKDKQIRKFYSKSVW